jgi:uncharacterized protein YndB with AHSA1/START domain
MIEVDVQLGAVERRVAGRSETAGEARAVALTRTYDTTLEDLWDAVTNPERVPRWFLPLSGDLRPGGRYQLEGNAGGTIEHCDPPRRLRATWEFGGTVSWIEVGLSPLGDGQVRLELAHITPVADDDKWSQFGPGAVGVGWDLALVGLWLHLGSGRQVDPEAARAWSASSEGHEFITRGADGWRAADVDAGRDPDEARVAAERTAAFYTGAPEPS